MNREDDLLAFIMEPTKAKSETEWRARNEIMRLRSMVVKWKEVYFQSHDMLCPIQQDSSVSVEFPRDDQIRFDYEKRKARAAQL